MHNRPFDFKHWIADTRRLTPLERGIYFDMLAEYYTSEKALPADLDRLCRLVGAQERDEKKAVALILETYWTHVEDGVIQIRTAAEILLGKTVSNNKNADAPKAKKISGASEAKQMIRERLANAGSFAGASGVQMFRISSANLVSIIHNPISKNQDPQSKPPDATGGSDVERLVRLYDPIRRDAPTQCWEFVQSSLNRGATVQDIEAGVKACVSWIQQYPNWKSNGMIPSARRFFSEERWREPREFEAQSVKLREATAGSAQKNKEGAADLPDMPPVVSDGLEREPERFAEAWAALYVTPMPQWAGLCIGDKRAVRRWIREHSATQTTEVPA